MQLYIKGNLTDINYPTKEEFTDIFMKVYNDIDIDKGGLNEIVISLKDYPDTYLQVWTMPLTYQ